MISEAKDMQITAGRLLVLLFVLAAVAGVASVMGTPEFKQAQIAAPAWN